MKITSLIKSDSGYQFIDRNLTTESLEKENEIWIHIEVEDRAELTSLQPNLEIKDELIERLLNPGKSFRLERVGNVRLLDCNVNYDRDEMDIEYLTFLFYKETLITISTSASQIGPELDPDKVIDTDREYTNGLVALLIFGKMMDQNARYAKQLTRKVDKILKISINKDIEMVTDELEELYSEVIDFNELFEDQLTTLRLIPIEFKVKSQMQGFMERTEKSMDHLVNLTSRSIDKLDYIFLRHRSLLQEKGNARLNTLTVIQSVFVPLTFIAGIYGMNFVHMPELEWPSGYLYVWILMLIIALGSLFLFYRNGWFKSD